MSMKGKTLVKGHTLLFEGAPCGENVYRRSGPGIGKCSCGVLSQILPSNNARQRWHKQHKAEVLKQMEAKNG